MRSAWKVLKCGAGEEWRSFRRIVREMKYRVEEEGKAKWVYHILFGNYFLKHIIEGKIEWKDRSDGKTKKKT